MPSEAQSSFQGHPNSIQARAWRNPETRKKIREARKAYMEDSSSLETWFRNGCGAALQIEYREFPDD